jgi:CHAT domain-containing protein
LKIGHLFFIEMGYSFFVRLFIISLLSGSLCCKFVAGSAVAGESILKTDFYVQINSSQNNELIKQNLLLQQMLNQSDTSLMKPFTLRILRLIKTGSIDQKSLSDSYYLLGHFYYKIGKYNTAFEMMFKAAEIRENIKLFDDRYARIFYNISVFYGYLGELNNEEFYALKAYEEVKKIYGEGSPRLVETLVGLSISAGHGLDFQKSLFYSQIAARLVQSYPDSVDLETTSDFNWTIGTTYYSLADYSKALVYLIKAETIFNNSNLRKDTDIYLNLLNYLAYTYKYCGDTINEADHFRKAISLAFNSISYTANKVIANYCELEAEKGNWARGDSLHRKLTEKLFLKLGKSSRYYIDAINNYAEFLRIYNISYSKSEEYYVQGMEYLKKKPYDIQYQFNIRLGYSLTLLAEGKAEIALAVLNGLSDFQAFQSSQNPNKESIKPNKISLALLAAKGDILREIYRRASSQKNLLACAENDESIILMLDNLRANISEEESRNLLGKNNRDKYLNAIKDYNILYQETGNIKYLDKAFEFSEKSKVAGLLATTRELRATQLQIPENIASIEKGLLGEINFYNDAILKKSSESRPDTNQIKKLRDNLLHSIFRRDSLVSFFEKNYPEYYETKYNFKAAKLSDIPGIIGNSANYINYIISDTSMYIFIVNRKHQKLLSIPISQSFFTYLKQFRNQLLQPPPDADAKGAFQDYLKSGTYIYNILVEPVIQYLISDQLVISPDNLLSYIPFETLPVSISSSGNLSYRDINYMMNNFDISYTYSATLMAESGKRKSGYGNRLIAFSPNYKDPINIDEVLNNRQAGSGTLADLPFARQEAEFVTELTHGSLYENSHALESVYKQESGKYDIIHLAMHTLLNDKDPMYSTLLFSQNKDSLNDGYLKTYEIYGIPLKAKMVVLSACNTGSGQFATGEGIISLARGFIYSGSQSVIMSMWEIEDRSGTDVVKAFYKNLKKGMTKSVALHKARKDYLKNADLLRSHPYFWSTLVVYGNNNSLYYSPFYFVIISGIVLLVVMAALYYFKWRKYS